MIVGIVIGLVTLVGGSVAGAVLGPKLLGGSEEQEEEEKPAKGARSHKSDKKEKAGEDGDEAHGSSKGPEHIVTVDIPSVVVDLLDNQGRIRHLKVGLTAELADKVPAEEFRLFIPRGREAALTFLRSLVFEQVADPSHFIGIKDELAKRVSAAVGEERVHRMMLTDFVVQ